MDAYMPDTLIEDNPITHMRRASEMKNKRLRATIQVQDSVGSFQNNEKLATPAPMIRYNYALMSRRLVSEGIAYERRKNDYLQVIHDQEQEIEALKERIKLRQQRGGGAQADPHLLEERVQKIQGGYKSILQGKLIAHTLSTLVTEKGPAQFPNNDESSRTEKDQTNINPRSESDLDCLAPPNKYIMSTTSRGPTTKQDASKEDKKNSQEKVSISKLLFGGLLGKKPKSTTKGYPSSHSKSKGISNKGGSVSKGAKSLKNAPPRSKGKSSGIVKSKTLNSEGLSNSRRKGLARSKGMNPNDPVFNMLAQFMSGNVKK